MRIGRTISGSNKTRVVVLTADPAFREEVTATFTASPHIDLQVNDGTLAAAGDGFQTDGATVVVIDLDAGQEQEMQALAALLARVGAWPPVVVVTQAFDELVARRLLQMRVAD